VRAAARVEWAAATSPKATAAESAMTVMTPEVVPRSGAGLGRSPGREEAGEGGVAMIRFATTLVSSCCSLYNPP
jgi:hypothetical protein